MENDSFIHLHLHAPCFSFAFKDTVLEHFLKCIYAVVLEDKLLHVNVATADADFFAWLI